MYVLWLSQGWPKSNLFSNSYLFDWYFIHYDKWSIFTPVFKTAEVRHRWGWWHFNIIQYLQVNCCFIDWVFCELTWLKVKWAFVNTRRLSSFVRRKRSHVYLLWNHWTKLNKTWLRWSILCQKFELIWSLLGEFSKLFVTLPFSISFRSQIENQMSDYRLLWASSFNLCIFHRNCCSTIIYGTSQ
jgi:hypothetical protein